MLANTSLHKLVRRLGRLPCKALLKKARCSLFRRVPLGLASRPIPESRISLSRKIRSCWGALKIFPRHNLKARAPANRRLQGLLPQWLCSRSNQSLRRAEPVGECRFPQREFPFPTQGYPGRVSKRHLRT